MTPEYQDKLTESDGTQWSVHHRQKWRKAFSAEDHSNFFAMGAESVVYEPVNGEPVAVTAMISDSPDLVKDFPGIDSEHRSGMARYARIHILDPDDTTQAWTLGCSSGRRPSLTR